MDKFHRQVGIEQPTQTSSEVSRDAIETADKPQVVSLDQLEYVGGGDGDGLVDAPTKGW